MPVRNFQDDLLLKLRDSEFAEIYLNTAVEEMMADGNTEALLLALTNCIEALHQLRSEGQPGDTSDRGVAH